MQNVSQSILLEAQNTLQAHGYVPLSISDDLEAQLEEVRGLLQDALLIEHATIPVYLTMLYTLDPNANWRVIECIRSVVVEEMLHFALAGNLLNAVGGQPKIYDASFMPDYPTRLPHNVDDMEVHLLSFSKEAVAQGKQIEKAAYIRAEAVLKGPADGMSIGEFYTYIESKLRAMVKRFGNDAVFCGDPEKQIPPRAFYYDGGGDLVEIRTIDDAVEAIEIIKDQGEGAHRGIWTGDTSETMAGYTEVAHYFRFDELYQERLYQKGDTIESGPTGAPLEVPWNSSYPTVSDAKLSDYPEDSEAYQYINAFNRRYCELLSLLQLAFDGQPDLLMEGVVGMCSLREDFTQITRNPFPGRPNYFAAPTFEFVAGLHWQPPKDNPSSTPSTKPSGGGCPHANPNRATVDALQDAYSKGDLQAALATMTEDVIWDISGPSNVPYTGVYYGHDGFSNFWSKLGQTLKIEHAGFQHLLVEGDMAVGLGGEAGTVIANNAPYHYDWAVSYTFTKDHKIKRMRQYYDPDRIEAAITGPDWPAPSSTQQPSKGDSNMTHDIKQGQPLPAVPEGFTMPFYYSSLTNVGVFYLVPAERVAPYLDGTNLTAALFNGEALVSFNFQLYTGQFASGLDTEPENWASSGAAVTQELELNIVCFPTSQIGRVAQVSFEQFMLGDEQSKLMGNHRVHVPCDADIAIAAGKTLFGEPKFKTTFKVNLASLNPVRQNTMPYQPEWVETWGFRVDDPNDSSEAIFTCRANLGGLTKYPGNFSPITEYGTFEDRLIGCRWNILQPMSTCFLDDQTASRVELIYGASDHIMKQDMHALLDGCNPRAVRTFNSAPAAIQSRAYYP